MIFARKKVNKDQNNGRVLIVEDDLSDREFFCQTLSKANYKPTTVGEGDAIETAAKMDSHLIIMSAVLSGRKSLDLCTKLKATKETKHIPILVVAKKADKSNVVEFYSQNADCYLMKPISRNELLNQVKILLNPQER